MPCYFPMQGFRSKTLTDNGKRKIVFSKNQGFEDLPVTLPCGQCIGCRLEHSRQWAIRCLHEASLHEHNCFLTLTFDDEHLPKSESLDVRDLQLFMKRLRKEYGKGIRFYACGEYGEKYYRPHYHLCLFNHDFHDKYLWKMSNDKPLYRSKSLEKIWPFGHSSIGEVTFESAAYCARYIMKKVTGDRAKKYYEWVDENGEVHQLKPEFTTQSRRPGLASGWLKKYLSDVYPDDFIIINGKKVRPPKFYDKHYEVMDPSKFQSTKKKRKTGLKKHAENNTRERLDVRRNIQELKLDRLKRSQDTEL